MVMPYDKADTPCCVMLLKNEVHHDKINWHVVVLIDGFMVQFHKWRSTQVTNDPFCNDFWNYKLSIALQIRTKSSSDTSAV